MTTGRAASVRPAAARPSALRFCFIMAGMGWKKILLIAAAAFTALVLLTVTWLFTANLGFVKPRVERLVTGVTGRDFSIDGRLDIFLGGESVVVAERLTFENADWAAEPAMFSVSRVELRLDTWSLLDGVVRILDLVVDDPEFYLERREDGSANWQFAGSDQDEHETDRDPEGAGGRFLLRQVDIGNGRIHLRSPDRVGPIDLRIAHLSQSMDDEGFLDLSLDAMLGEREVVVEGTVGTWDDLLAARDIDFEISSTIDTLAIDAQGHIDDLTGPSRPRLDLTVRGPDLNDLARLLRAREQFEGGVDLAVSLAPADDGRMVLELGGNLGRLEAEAQGSFGDLQHLQQAELDLTIAGPDLGRLLSLFGGPRLPPAPYRIEVEAERRGPELLVRQAHMEYADSVLDLSADLPGFPSIDDSNIRLSLRGERFERFREVTGMPGAATGPYSLTLEVTDVGDGAEVVSLGLQSSLGTVTGDGTLGNAPDYFGSQFNLQLATDSLAAVADAYGLPSLPDRPLAVDGHFAWIEGGIRVDGPASITSGDLSADVAGLVSLSPALVGSSFDLSADLPDISVVGREFAGTELLPPEALHLDGRLEVTERGYRFPSISVDIGRSSVELQGLVSRESGLVNSTISLNAEGPAFEELTAALESPKFQPGPFTLSLNVEREADAFRVDGFEFTRPRGRLAGSFAVDLPFSDYSMVFDISGRGDDFGGFSGALGGFQPASRPFDLVVRGNNRSRLLTVDQLDLRLGDAEVSARGTVDLKELTGDTRLSVNAAVPDLANLGTFNGRAFNSQGLSLGAEVNVNRGTRVLTVDNLALRVGDSDLRGIVSVRGGEPPELTVRLESDSLRFAPLLEPAEEEYDPSPEFDDGRLIPDTPIPLGVLGRLNAALEVDIGEFQRGSFEVRSLGLDATLRDGILELEHLGFLGHSGWLQAKGSLGTSEGAGRAEFAMSTRDLSLTFAKFNQDLGGRIRFDANLEATGNDLRSMAASSHGAILGRVDNLTIIESTVLKRIYGDLLNEIVSTINPFAKTTTEQKLNCVVAPLQIRNGKVTSAPELLMRTDKLRIVSEASINLANEKIEMQFNTTPRSGITISAGELFNPYVKVVGTLASPRLAVDQQGVLISGGAAVATGGLSVLAQAAWRRISRDGNPCESLQKAGLEALGADAFVEFPEPVSDATFHP